jgi:hypothetical protein
MEMLVNNFGYILLHLFLLCFQDQYLPRNHNCRDFSPSYHLRGPVGMGLLHQIRKEDTICLQACL